MDSPITAQALVGIPIYRFGSPELAALHTDARNPPLRAREVGTDWYSDGMGSWRPRSAYSTSIQVYGEQHDSRSYIVDHGRGSYTLNTIQAGQVVPDSRHIPRDVVQALLTQRHAPAH